MVFVVMGMEWGEIMRTAWDGKSPLETGWQWGNLFHHFTSNLQKFFFRRLSGDPEDASSENKTVFNKRLKFSARYFFGWWSGCLWGTGTPPG